MPRSRRRGILVALAVVAAVDGVHQTPAVFLGADPVDLATLTPERLQALLQG